MCRMKISVGNARRCHLCVLADTLFYFLIQTQKFKEIVSLCNTYWSCHTRSLLHDWKRTWHIEKLQSNIDQPRCGNVFKRLLQVLPLFFASRQVAKWYLLWTDIIVQYHEVYRYLYLWLTRCKSGLWTNTCMYDANYYNLILTKLEPILGHLT